MPFKPGKSGNPTGREKGSKNEISSLAKAIYLKALTQSLPEVKSALEEVRAEDAYKYLQLVEKFAQKLIPNQLDVTSDGNELSMLSNDELISRLNRIIAKEDKD